MTHIAGAFNVVPKTFPNLRPGAQNPVIGFGAGKKERPTGSCHSDPTVKKTLESHACSMPSVADAAAFDEISLHRAESLHPGLESDALDLEIVQPPETAEYVKYHAAREKAKLEKIGRRFSAPGRMVGGVENYAKSLSRKTIEKTRNLLSTASNAVCDKTVSALKASVEAIEDWQSTK